MSKKELTTMPISRRRAQELVREIASDSSRVVNTLIERQTGAWQRTVTARQINLTLLEGEVLWDPVVNEHGHWECALHRDCAGLDVVVHVAIQNSDAGCMLYVIEVENRL